MDKLEERPHWTGTNFLLGTLSMQSCPIDFETDQLGKVLVQWNQATRTNCRVDTVSTATDPFCCCNYRVGIQNMLQLPHRCIDQSDSRRKLVHLATG